MQPIHQSTDSQTSKPIRLPTLLMTEAETAAALGVDPRTLQAWRVRGGGPPFLKLGRLVRYRRDALDAWLASRERSSTSDPGEDL